MDNITIKVEGNIATLSFDLTKRLGFKLCLQSFIRGGLLLARYIEMVLMDDCLHGVSFYF